MKSGLKDAKLIAETLVKLMVATYAAMKSGLKERLHVQVARQTRSSNLCRDEKRTERQFYEGEGSLSRGSNLCRDEKRTER